MKTLKSALLLLLTLTGSIAGPFNTDIQPRTDINPALHYYQAYLLAPELAPADHDFLFTNEWRGQKLTGRFGEMVSRYDNAFKLTRLAARQTVPCEWGIDMSPGPGTLLPQLARNKGIALAARYRVMWHLKQGHPSEAKDDLLAALVLARNSSRDGTLISVLVQIAMENILCSVVAENLYQLPPETMREIAAGFDATPGRGTVASCIPSEKAYFHDWLLAKILELQKENPGNDAKVMAGIQGLAANLDGGGEGQTNSPQASLWDEINRASGGKSDKVVSLLRDEEGVYERLRVIMTLPLAEYENQIAQFAAEVQNSPNPFISHILPAITKCRPKEFAIRIKLAMIRAAVAYQENGEAGLKSVLDISGSAPFEFERFTFEGVDRGFVLKSSYEGRGFPEKLIFIQKDGAPFFIDGPRAGQPLSK